VRKAFLRSRKFIVMCVSLGLVILGLLIWRNSSRVRQQSKGAAPTIAIDKQPVAFVSHTFDPNSPPSDMPSLAYGEEAVCDSNFSSQTTVGGLSEKIDDTHATVTITTVKMILQLSVNIWVPFGVSQHVVEHENGHRQISEYYYQAADKLADRVASTYIGTKIDIAGADLNAQFDKALGQAANDITAEFDKNINLAATQQYYDTITDHGRSESDAKQAVVAAVANTKITSLQPSVEPSIDAAK
jgi:hypothetical protein